MSSNTNAYKPIPNKVFGLDGANQRESALNYQLQNDEAQNRLNKTHGGRRRRSHKSRKIQRRRRGGAAKLEVPSFPTYGPQVSPTNSTSNSQATNQALLDAKVAACNDCYATGTCANSPGCPQPQSGGRRGRPYAISAIRVRRSPFASIASVRKTLRSYRKGKKIGYTQRSSLKSMGLIPRSKGKYSLGTKYSGLSKAKSRRRVKRS